MKATIKIDTTRITKNNQFPIKIYVTHNYSRVTKNYGYSSTAENWNFDKELPMKSHPNYFELYSKIQNDRAFINSNAHNYEDVKQFHKAVMESKNKSLIKETPTFIEFSEHYINNLKLMGREKTAGIYQTAINEFSKIIYSEITFDEIDYTLLNQFKVYKFSQKASRSTVSNYLRCIRAIIYEAARNYNFEAKRRFEGVFNNLHQSHAATKKKYITEDAIRKMEQVKYTRFVETARKLFLLMFYMGGIDLIDLYNAKQKDISKNRLYYKRSKLAGNAIINNIGILPKAQEMIDSLNEEYKNENKKALIYCAEKYGEYESFRRNVYRSLKSIQKDLKIDIEPQGGFLGVKVARHTFANIALQKRIPFEIRRALMGHQRTDIGAAYEDEYDFKVLDKALSIIIEL